MTDEELEKLMQELAEQIKQLHDDPAKPLSKAERKHRVLLQARLEALGGVKAAREKHDMRLEARAGIDYVLVTEYGEKNFILYNLMKSRAGWWHRW